MSFTFRNLFSEEDGVAGTNGDRNFQSGDPNRGQSGSESSAQPPSMQNFQVSELLPFIPPAISAESGIPMGKMVSIPMPSNGSGDIALSTLYQIVPELFAAEITPLNDSRVTLPVKIAEPENSKAEEKKRVSGSIFEAPGQASAARSGDAFSAGSETSGAAFQQTEEDNPFWSPDENKSPPLAAASTSAGGPPALPRQVATVQVKAGSGGFSAPEGEAREPVAVSGAEVQSSQASPVFGTPAETAPPPFSDVEGRIPGAEKVELKMPSGFETPTAKDKGEATGDGSPEEETGFGKGANPFADFTPPESLPLSEPAGTPAPPADGSTRDDSGGPAAGNPFESSDDFSTLFSKQAEEDSDIPFPYPEGESGESWGAMFDSEPKAQEASVELPKMEPGFGNMIKQVDSSVAAPKAKAEPEAPAMPSWTEDSPAAEPESEKQAPTEFMPPKPPAETGGFEGFEKALPSKPAQKEDPSPARPEAVENPPVEEKAPEPSEELPGAMSGFAAFPDTEPVEDSQSEPTAETPPGDVRGDESPETSGFQDDPAVAEAKPNANEVAEEVELPLPETRGPVSLTPLAETSDTSLRDLEFRAIFSSDEAFTLARVARRVIDLQGIYGCALATPSRMVQASKNEQSRLQDEAREMVGTIRNLAKLTGLPEARSFTLQTDQGTVSLFLEGDCCVSVHHDAGAFGPGVKEKLILIARSIHKLKE
jgi:hypothetical protein